MKRVFAAALLLLLGACAQPVPPERLPSIRTVGVVSMIGSDFTLKTIGYTVFGNDTKKLPTDGWRIDEFVVERVGAALRGRYDVRPVSYRTGSLTPGSMAFPGEQGLFSKRRTVGEAIRDEVTPRGLDAYVLVLPASGQFGITNQSVGGLGIVETPGGLFRSHIAQLHALYYVSVIDGRDYRVIGDARAPELEDAGFMPAIRGPYRTLPDGWLIPAVAAMPDAQREPLKAMLEELIDRSLPAALRRLQLID